MTLVVTHTTVTGAPADATALVDGPAWDANHTLAGQASLAQGGTNADLSATGGAGQVLKQTSVGGAVTVGPVAASDITSGAALTRTNDTNVTITLGGTPATAMLAATSLTVGWSGTLAETRGGTGKASYAVGDILYADTTTTLAKLADVATGNALISGGVGVAPSYGKIGLSTHVSGNLPVTNLNSGTSASSSTFWRGDGTWASPGGGVSSVNGQTGALVSYFPPQGRITLSSGVPVMGTSQSGATTVYYTPYCGNMVPIYDGTNMVPTAVAEVSQATTDSTKSPAAVAASKVYDLFVWNDSGTIRCTRGPAWSSSTSRGYTFTMVNGILLNTSAITNGPGASRGTYVGTIASNSGSTIDYIFGTAGSSGVAGLFNVWNAYNRVNVACQVVDTAASYTYTSSTVRQAHASTAMQVGFVVGLAEDAVSACYMNVARIVASTGAFLSMGVGLDSITALNGAKGFCFPGVANTLPATVTASCVWNPGIGSHYVAALEASDNINANTFNDAGATTVNGLQFQLRM